MRKVFVIGDGSYIGCKIKAWLNTFLSAYYVDIISSRENKSKEADYTKYATVVNTTGLAHIDNITENMKPLFYAINRDLPINIGKNCKENGVKHFIHFNPIYISLRRRYEIPNKSKYISRLYNVYSPEPF